MNRRARALTLIALLAGGTTARPAIAQTAVRAQVAARPAERARLEALCASMRKSGLEVRLACLGRVTWAEIVGIRGGDLAAAIAALRRAAEAEGIELCFRPGAEEACEAISAGATEVVPAEGADSRPGETPPAAVATPADRVEAVAIIRRLADRPKLPGIARDPARTLRGPPA